MVEKQVHPTVIRLVEAYKNINEQKMQGLPIVNERLEVEAVGFTLWEGRWLGIIISPWFMNLTLLPAEHEDWSDLDWGVKRVWGLPSSDYEFIVSPIEGVGVYQSLSLFTTVTDFPDQHVARAVAQAIMDKLLVSSAEGSEQAILSTKEALGKIPDNPVSRRELLRKFVPINS
ncbi:MAG: [NiFe]-hydrogenase assembly chaperone HybE [Gammaproteobacteria bacterium]|nr:[NiFe]-hydrogenase assembly chaperone HybE [Gammaproteobacteria bacterium]